jgi:hypothetical protein
LRYEPGQPIPSGYHVEERVRRGLVIAGAITFGIPYAYGLTVAADDNSTDKTGYLFVPVLGPWLMLAAGGANRNCGSDVCFENSGRRALLFLDGITQATGAILLTAGIAYPTKRLVRDQIALSFTPTPIGHDGYGLGAVGTF